MTSIHRAVALWGEFDEKYFARLRYLDLNFIRSVHLAWELCHTRYTWCNKASHARPERWHKHHITPASTPVHHTIIMHLACVVLRGSLTFSRSLLWTWDLPSLEDGAHPA